MKHLLPALLITINSISLFAQNANTAIPYAIEDIKMDNYLQGKEPAVLKIRLLNRSVSEKTGVSYTMVTFGPSTQVKKITQLNENGEANIILEQNLPYQQLWLTVDNYLYAGIYVNTDLTVTIDASKVKQQAYWIADGITYTGKDGELNTVMNEYILFRKKEQNELQSRLFNLCINKANEGFEQPQGKTEEAAFRKTVDSIKQRQDEIDKAFLEKYPLYTWAVKNETESEFYHNLAMAYSSSQLPQIYKQRVLGHKPYFTSNGGVYFYRELVNYLRWNKSRVKQQVFDELHRRYSMYNTEQKALLDSIKIYESLMKQQQDERIAALNILYKKGGSIFFKEIKAIRIAEDAKYIDKTFAKPKSDILKLILMEDGKDAFQVVYPILLENMTTGWCRRRAKEEIEMETRKQREIDDLLVSGKKLNGSSFYIGTPMEALAFGADLYRTDSVASINDFILNLRAKFQGKALIIDFWATWCGPCIADMPLSKKLHEENKDLPVEYIYLCTKEGATEDLWKKRIIEARLPGTHIYADDKIITELKNKLNARSGFPAYVVIDINGKNSGTAINWMSEMDREKLKEVIGL